MNDLNLSCRYPTWTADFSCIIVTGLFLGRDDLIHELFRFVSFMNSFVLFHKQGSLACLKTRGYMVSFGQSSGPADPVPLSALAAKSLFLTRPSLMQYTATRDELLEAAQEVFANIESGTLRVRVNHTYPLFEAARAHADLKSRKTTGSIVLIP